MKHKLVVALIFTFACLLLWAGQPAISPDSNLYDTYKQNQPYVAETPVVPTQPSMSYQTQTSSSKDIALLIPLDGTFTVAMPPNDDGFVGPIVFPFNFTLYGTVYTSCWINNNGNLSFDGGYSSYTPWGFPIAGYPMVAPFFADVDTRGAGNVYYKIEANRLTVIWDHVGYYNAATDKINTFEAIITDGTDPLVGIGNTVCFSYEDMAWTTGSASGGSGGLGGTAATVGINKGADDLYAQVGRFDQAGSAYDGPVDLNDGVDWLDGKIFYFNTFVAGGTMLIIPSTPEIVLSGGAPEGVDPLNPNLDAFLATYPIVGTQTVTIPVGPGIWYGWAYWGGVWHPADVNPVTGPGSIVFSNVPFGAKFDVPIILDSDPVITPIPETSLPGGYPNPCPAIDDHAIFHVYTVEWSGIHNIKVDPIPGECHAVALIDGIWEFGGAPYWTWNNVNFTTNDPLYVITYGGPTPVELASFSAITTSENFVKLTWVTSSETGMSGYNVFRADTNDIDAATHMGFEPSTNSSTEHIYTMTDTEVEINATYYYWLQTVDMGGDNTMHGPVTVTVLGNVTPPLPQTTVLGNAYPNPFKANTSIGVSVKEGENATLTIYNISGQAVRSYSLTAGNHTIDWDGRDVNSKLCASGVYFYKLTSPSLIQTRKMVIVK